MRVLHGIAHDHDPLLVLLAVLMCVAGSYVSVRLFRHTLEERGASRIYWTFLSSISAGAAIWATHFIAMLGHRPGAPVSFDAALTVLSALIAVAGTAFSLVLLSCSRRSIAIIGGGCALGITISTMHYVGMSAYRVEGTVNWILSYVAGSILISIVACMLCFRYLEKSHENKNLLVSTAFFSFAIAALHFVGMAAFVVSPNAGLESGADGQALGMMATAVALVGFLIIGLGISTHMLERRTASESQAKFRSVALQDDLTEIANRRAFKETLVAECSQLKQGGPPFALFLVDLDRFKAVNDTLGHPIGDVVLQRTAGRIRSAVRPNDLIARLGGDEFAVLAYGIRHHVEAEAIAARIVEILDRPFVIESNVAELGASIGVVAAPEDGTDADELIRLADIALYSAKREGRRQYCVFRSELAERLAQQRKLESDLRRACSLEEFDLVYQPIANATNGDITGAEALLRWSCAERGAVPPSEFIPIAEDLGLLSQMGAGVLKQACRDAAHWPEKIDLSVNISPIQLLDPRLPQTIVQALAGSGLSAERLELEITEDAILGNDDLALGVLRKVQALGVRISLDDFGIGYSSLSHLHRFPINRIKIDKSIMQKVAHDASSQSITRSIAQLGQSMGLKITAEGIETEDQLAFATIHGCTNLQGFLIGKPMSKDDLAALLRPKQERSIA